MQQEKARPRPSLGERVYHLIYSRISNGTYAPNEKLPPEKQLALEFGVSRPVLRSAIERLRGDGLVYSRQGAGSYVRAPAAAALGFQRIETIADIQRCYEFRLTIETDAAFLAAQRRDEGALKEMQDALALLSAATGSFTHREDADFAFHFAVTRAANNQYYDAAMRALRDHIHVGMKMHGQSLMTEGLKGLEAVLSEHTGIFAAIRDRQPDQARVAMREHIIHSRDRLFGGRLIDLSMDAAALRAG
jgi:GntR family transcriptional regulator, transcriptional repressor for pyruvate dehydrogenase complex